MNTKHISQLQLEHRFCDGASLEQLQGLLVVAQRKNLDSQPLIVNVPGTHCLDEPDGLHHAEWVHVHRKYGYFPGIQIERCHSASRKL